MNMETATEIPWRCFHCDFVTSDPAEAEAHFGDRDDVEGPTCRDLRQWDDAEKVAQWDALYLELNGERDHSSRLRQEIETLDYVQGDNAQLRKDLAKQKERIEMLETGIYKVLVEYVDDTVDASPEEALVMIENKLGGLPGHEPEEGAHVSRNAVFDVDAGLTFRQLREANLDRLPHFKNGLGAPAHSEPDGSDWSLTDWFTAVAGELGEAGNIIKKIRRGDLLPHEARSMLARELADVQTYLDHLAYQANIDLGLATVEKWNEVSERIDSPVRLSN